MADKKWRKGPKGIAHFVVGTRARCSNGGFPKGRVVEPPTQGDEKCYCYSCHYHSLFDVMPKAKATVLIKLMNREIEEKIRQERDQNNAYVEGREKSVRARLEEIVKREDEVAKLKREQEGNKKLVEIGTAFSVLSKEFGESIAKAALDYERQHMGFRRAPGGIDRVTFGGMY